MLSLLFGYILVLECASSLQLHTCPSSFKFQVPALLCRFIIIHPSYKNHTHNPSYQYGYRQGSAPLIACILKVYRLVTSSCTTSAWLYKELIQHPKYQFGATHCFFLSDGPILGQGRDLEYIKVSRCLHIPNRDHRFVIDGKTWTR